MNNSIRSFTLAAALLGHCALADTVITTDGARLTGTIVGIENGSIQLSTSYAGTITISQDAVASFETEEPVVVRLASGTVMTGPIESIEGGGLRIQSEDGVLETRPAKVAATWAPGSEDPAVTRTRKKWQYDATLDLNGRTGNTDALRIGTSLEARYKGPDDELALFFEYEQAEEENNKTEDRVAGGASYETFFTGKLGWYARTELETDNIDNIKLRSTTAAGLSYRFINSGKQNLVGRFGAGYRFTSFDNNLEDESSAAIDFGLAHSYRFRDLIDMENDLTFVPSVDDFGNFRVVHDTGIEVPVGSGQNWKLRFGVRNEYESEPATDTKLDTSYYTKMIYSWD